MAASWKRGDFSVPVRPIPNFLESKPEPSESGWAELRRPIESVGRPNTGMAVAIDLGEWNDVHPLTRKTSEAAGARGQENGLWRKDLVVSGPLFQNHEGGRHRLILTFSNIGGGLVVKGGGELKHSRLPGRTINSLGEGEIDGITSWSGVIVSHPLYPLRLGG